ncbi:MAG TPA: ParB/RepB/Spo0J family partition protein [Candidatus Brocadiales bacterium]|nr:ParB/RepB/Spo0J family partition protein [Candidatus Brocadiales bacterium]
MLDRGKLARGLETILGNIAVEEMPGSSGSRVLHVDPNLVQPNPHQPRKNFDPQTIKSLTESIREHGLLQPILVRPGKDGGYQLVAGERRWRAARELGLNSIPVIIKDMGNKQSLSVALVENLQREDLNPIEKARAFWELIEVFGLTQEEVGRYTGIDRSTVANFLRLLELPIEVQELVSRGTISPGHARALISLGNETLQRKLCQRIIEEGLTVREVEAIASGVKTPKPNNGVASVPAEEAVDPKGTHHMRSLEDRLRRALGLKVQIRQSSGRGKIILYFQGNGQFERLVGLLGATSA